MTPAEIEELASLRKRLASDGKLELADRYITLKLDDTINRITRWAAILGLPSAAAVVTALVYALWSVPDNIAVEILKQSQDELITLRSDIATSQGNVNAFEQQLSQLTTSIDSEFDAAIERTREAIERTRADISSTNDDLRRLREAGNLDAAITLVDAIARSGASGMSQLLQQLNSLVPRGTIVAWTGSTAPAGWLLCDGRDGTPDLRGRFLAGASASGPVATEAGSAGHRHAVNFQSNFMAYEIREPDLQLNVLYDSSTSITAEDRRLNHRHQVVGESETASSLPPTTFVNFIMKM
jgi:hypothetical protein